MEQTFSLLIQKKFELETALAGYETGLILMFSGITGAIVQGGLIRRLVPRFGELPLLRVGLVFYLLGLILFPYGPTLGTYFILILPFALGMGLVNPNIMAMISQTAGPEEQGSILGLTQGLSSLARAVGPFVGLIAFDVDYHLPYSIAATVSVFLVYIAWGQLKKVHIHN